MSKVKFDHNRYTYRVTWSEEDGEHVALCAEFPSLSYLSKSPLKALQGMVKLVGHFDHSPLDLLICDVAGKAVYRSRLFQGKSTIDISTLGKGLYIALVFRNGVLVRSEKLVKE